MNFDVSETQESRVAEEPLSVSATPLRKSTTIASKPSGSNEHQHQVMSCPRLSRKYVKKYPKIVKLCTGCATAAVFDFIINRLSLHMGKSSILKGMKWK